MSRLAISTIIACDAALLSPVQDGGPWDSTCTDSYGFYYPPSPPNSDNSPPSPAQSQDSMLKRRAGSESIPEGDLCMPTHQVFDLHAMSSGDSLSSPPSSPKRERLSISINPGGKRSASPAPSATKRTKGNVNSKDFVPPDVSGLSKREARLVKNRAAAFLSRQRKREEFETMEVRVAELEQENARLLALTQSGGPSPPAAEVVPEELLSEVERLRAQLAAASARERELAAELAQKASAPPTEVPVKLEAVEPRFPPAATRTSSMQSTMRSSASLGLMVLLCALPTLLSMPTHSTLPARFTLPITGASFPPPSSTFDYNSIINNEFDWSHTTPTMDMDLDIDERSSVDQATATVDNLAPARKLEFVDFDSEALSGLGQLDISFDASPSDAGKIRVRIHTPESSDAGSTPPLSPRIKVEGSPSMLNAWSSMDSEAMSSSESFRSSSPTSSTSAGDPFLGVGTMESDFGLGAHYAPDGSCMSGMYSETDGLAPVEFAQLQVPDTSFGFGSPSEYGGIVAGDHAGKRRVRIALKSMPTAGGEGGEWEVELR